MASDLTGLLAPAAGVVLVALAAYIPWRHRGGGTAGARRWAFARRVPVGLLFALFSIVVPVGTAITETHKFREPIGAPPSADYREVAFERQRRRPLSGWYRPTRNGATVIVLHGGGGDRTGAVPTPACSSATATASCSTTPAAAGAARARRTRSGGAGAKDVAGACAFLKGRPEVDPARIGGLGLSTGADALIQAAGLRMACTRSSPTARPPSPSRTGGACRASAR